MAMTKSSMPETMYRASRCCRMLGNPTAYLIVKCLGKSKKTPTRISEDLQVSLQTVSTTLRHLRLIDVVRYETNRNSKDYWLKDPAFLDILRSLETWIDNARQTQA